MEAEQEMEVETLEPVSALQLLQSVYQNPTVGLTTRMRAAMACLPFESPKLAVTAVIAENDFATVLDRRLKRRRTQSKQRQLSMARRLTFACLQWCLIDAFAGFDHYRTGRDLVILGAATGTRRRTICLWSERRRSQCIRSWPPPLAAIGT